MTAMTDAPRRDPYRAPDHGDDLGAYAGPAGLPRRAIALLIDYGVLLAIGAAMNFAIGRLGAAGGLDDGAIRTVAAFAIFGVISLYFAALESSTSQGTLGKIALGVQVTGRDGQPISFGRALLRFAAKLVSLLPVGLGLLLAAFTTKHAALHDLLAGTLVQRVR